MLHQKQTLPVIVSTQPVRAEYSQKAIQRQVLVQILDLQLLIRFQNKIYALKGCHRRYHGVLI
jgi:hypothetical protein